jgi:hypothetical protein
MKRELKRSFHVHLRRVKEVQTASPRQARDRAGFASR